MISAVAFSRNRACQLDALLNSLAVNAPGVFDVTVLWRVDDQAFLDGYLKLMPMHPRVKWAREVDFREQLLNGMPEVCRPLIARRGHLVFFTDDDILYRPLPGPLPLGDLFCFSLRLGENTQFCYPHSRRQRMPHPGWTEGDHLEWDWRDADGDWGYPGSLDGHIFHRDLFAGLLHGSGHLYDQWTNPNTLEDALCAGVKDLQANAPGLCLPMGCFPHSVLVNVPANAVTDTHRSNRVMDAPAYSPEALNEMFLDGWRIAWRDMDYSGVNAAHVELAYKFDKALP